MNRIPASGTVRMVEGLGAVRMVEGVLPRAAGRFIGPTADGATAGARCADWKCICRRCGMSPRNMANLATWSWQSEVW